MAGWSGHDFLRVVNRQLLLEGLLDARLVVRIQRQRLLLGLALVVEELVGHAGLAGDAHGALELAAGLGWLDEGGRGHDNLLGTVVLLRALTLVLGLLDLGFFIGGVQVLNDVRVELLDLLLERRKALDSDTECDYNLRHIEKEGSSQGKNSNGDGPI